MLGSDLIPCGLFLAGILLSAVAGTGLSCPSGPSWRAGFLTAAGVGLVFCACAVAIR